MKKLKIKFNEPTGEVTVVEGEPSDIARVHNLSAKKITSDKDIIPTVCDWLENDTSSEITIATRLSLQ